MKLTATQSRALLTYAGTLPFIAAAISLASGYAYFPVIGDVTQVVLVYALVIAAFMAGSQWGQQFEQSEVWAKRLQRYTNLNAIGLWLAFVLLPFSWLLVALIVSLLGALWLDQQLFRVGIITKTYWQTRWQVTIVVVLSLVVVGVSV